MIKRQSSCFENWRSLTSWNAARSLWSVPHQTVDKVYFFDLCCKSLAEFRRPQTAEEGQIVFSGGVYVGKHTSQASSVRAKASARRGLHPLEKMLAFLRSVSKFFDTLAGGRDIMSRPPVSLSRNPAMHQA